MVYLFACRHYTRRQKDLLIGLAYIMTIPIYCLHVKKHQNGLDVFSGKEPPRMTGTRQIVLHVSPELYGRTQARADADRFDLHEWVLRTVIGELLRPETELADERRTRAAIAALPPGPPQPERKT